MASPPFKDRKDNMTRLEMINKALNRGRVRQRMIHQENERALDVLTQSPDPCLKRARHPLLVLGVEDRMFDGDSPQNFFTMMAQHNYGLGAANRPQTVENILEKGAAAKWQKRLGTPHALRLTGREYDCCDQWVSEYRMLLMATRYA